jgi:hypothetical protein
MFKNVKRKVTLLRINDIQFHPMYVGSETWIMGKNDKRRIEMIYTSFLRSLVRVIPTDRL